MFKKRKLSRIAYLLMSLLLMAGLVFPMAALPVKGAGNPQKIANMVIFVKMKGDTRDIYNAVVDTPYGTRYYNWQQIRNMYDGGTGSGGDNSFSNYIKTVSEGKIEVVNVFPQEYVGDDGIARVRTLELSQASYDYDSQMIAEVIAALNNGTIPIDTSQIKLDNLNRGILDNLTIVVQGNDINGLAHSYRAQYGGTETFGAARLRVSEYNALYSASLVTDNGSVGSTLSQQGVIAHEFLHTLDLKDLYRFDNSGIPVGMWDIMGGVSSFLQYPLGYSRAQRGWISSTEITAGGTYTLTAVSEQGGNKLFTIRTPMTEADSEIICLEYRKKNTDINGFERSIYSSGLLMYRVDTSVVDGTNSGGENYIYVYRPGVTDPESAADVDSNRVNLISKAALDVSAGETEYGSTDLNKPFTDNTLYYSDGKNSGVRISEAKLSADGNSITFKVDFADYNAADVWDSMGKNVGTDVSGDPFIYADPATGKLYMAYAAQNGGTKQVVVKRWNEKTASWEQIGSSISAGNAMPYPVVSVCGGELYVAYLNGSTAVPVYRKLSGNSWSNTVSLGSAQYPQALQLIVDGNNIYAAYSESLSGGGAKMVIRDLKNNKVVTDTLKANYFSSPSVVKLGSQFYVAYADFPNGNGKIDAFNLNTSQWSTVHEYSIKSNSHILQVKDGKLYGFAGASDISPIVTVYDGSQWKDTTVTKMKKYYSPSMEIVQGVVCLTYLDNVSDQVMMIRQSDSGFETCYDNLGNSLVYLDTCSYGKTVYMASQAMNSSTVIVRRKDMQWQDTSQGTEPSTPVNPPTEPTTPVTPPTGPSNPGTANPGNPAQPPWMDEVNKRTGVDGFVYRLYAYALNREPDEGGLNDWKNKLTARERTGTEVAVGFFFSDEMKLRNLNDGDFVELLYKVMMNRDSDPDGKAYWLNMLDNGVSRMGVFNGFAGSAEFKNICSLYGIDRGTPAASEGRDKNYGATLFVARLYTQALGRGYDVDGLNDWCNRIVSRTWSVTDVSTTGFFHSQEFLNKNLSNEEYVKVLYRTFLGREYDAAGLADWTGQLNSGVKNRDQVLRGFSDSVEFADIMRQYGL